MLFPGCIAGLVVFGALTVAQSAWARAVPASQYVDLTGGIAVPVKFGSAGMGTDVFLWPPAKGRENSAQPEPRVIPDPPGYAYGLPDAGAGDPPHVPLPAPVFLLLGGLLVLAGLGRTGLKPKTPEPG
jgi:hypothetical protein